MNRAIIFRIVTVLITFVISIAIEKAIRREEIKAGSLRDLKVINKVFICISIMSLVVAIIIGDYIICAIMGFQTGLAIVDMLTKEITNINIILMIVAIATIVSVERKFSIFVIIILAIISIAVTIGKMGITDLVAMCLGATYFVTYFNELYAIEYIILSLSIFIIYSIMYNNKKECIDMLSSIAIANAVVIVEIHGVF